MQWLIDGGAGLLGSVPAAVAFFGLWIVFVEIVPAPEPRRADIFLAAPDEAVVHAAVDGPVVGRASTPDVFRRIDEKWAEILPSEGRDGGFVELRHLDLIIEPGNDRRRPELEDGWREIVRFEHHEASANGSKILSAFVGYDIGPQYNAFYTVRDGQPEFVWSGRFRARAPAFAFTRQVAGSEVEICYHTLWSVLCFQPNSDIVRPERSWQALVESFDIIFFGLVNPLLVIAIGVPLSLVALLCVHLALGEARFFPDAFSISLRSLLYLVPILVCTRLMVFEYLIGLPFLLLFLGSLLLPALPWVRWRRLRAMAVQAPVPAEVDDGRGWFELFSLHNTESNETKMCASFEVGENEKHVIEIRLSILGDEVFLVDDRVALQVGAFQWRAKRFLTVGETEQHQVELDVRWFPRWRFAALVDGDVVVDELFPLMQREHGSMWPWLGMSVLGLVAVWFLL